MEGRLVSEMASWRRTVIATGGGLGAYEEHLASLRQHALVVCLWAAPEAIWQRVRSQTHRPLLQEGDPLDKIRSLLELRAPVYKQADVLVNTGLRSIREVTAQVLHHFHIMRQRPIPSEKPH
jgi:shikimate kinase